MANIGPLAVRAGVVALNIAMVALSVWLFSLLANSIGIARCTSSLFLLSCDIPRLQTFDWPANVALLSLCLICVFLFQTVLKPYSTAPFFLLAAALMIFCSVFDMIFQLPVRNFVRLFGETFNLLSLVIFLSFTFVAVIVPADVRLYPHWLWAMLQSYIARDLIFLFYIGAQWRYLGMTALYLLFLAYSFGAFSIHIMSVGRVISQGGRLRIADDGPDYRQA